MAPAQQGFAAGDLVIPETDAGLVIDLQRTVCYRLAQIDFQFAACLYLRVHVRLEETIGSPPRRFGGIHRQIRILQNLIEIDTLLGSQRNANAGVGGYLMTETFEGLPDRIENPVHEIDDFGGGFDRALNDGEFVATQSGDEVVGASDATAQADGH